MSILSDESFRIKTQEIDGKMAEDNEKLQDVINSQNAEMNRMKIIIGNLNEKLEEFDNERDSMQQENNILKKQCNKIKENSEQLANEMRSVLIDKETIEKTTINMQDRIDNLCRDINNKEEIIQDSSNKLQMLADKCQRKKDKIHILNGLLSSKELQQNHAIAKNNKEKQHLKAQILKLSEESVKSTKQQTVLH
jgi:chromosome segregation ATPase